MLGLATVWGIMQALEVEAGNHPPEPTPRSPPSWSARFLAHDPESLAAMARLLATEPDRTDGLVAALRDPRRTRRPGPGGLRRGRRRLVPRKSSRETASRLGAPAVSFPEAAHSPAAEAPGPTAQTLVAFWERSEGAGQPPLAEEEQWQ